MEMQCRKFKILPLARSLVANLSRLGFSEGGLNETIPKMFCFTQCLVVELSHCKGFKIDPK